MLYIRTNCFVSHVHSDTPSSLRLAPWERWARLNVESRDTSVLPAVLWLLPRASICTIFIRKLVRWLLSPNDEGWSLICSMEGQLSNSRLILCFQRNEHVGTTEQRSERKWWQTCNCQSFQAGATGFLKAFDLSLIFPQIKAKFRQNFEGLLYCLSISVATTGTSVK